MVLLKPLLLLVLLMVCEGFQDCGSTPSTTKDWQHYVFANTSQIEEVPLTGHEIQVWLSNGGCRFSFQDEECDSLTFHILEEGISLQKVIVSMCKSFFSSDARSHTCLEVEDDTQVLLDCGSQNLVRLRFERFNGNLTVSTWIAGSSEYYLKPMSGLSQSNLTLRAENEKGNFFMWLLYQDPLPSGGPTWKLYKLEWIQLAMSAMLVFLQLMTLLVVIPCLKRKLTKVQEERIYDDVAPEDLNQQSIYDDIELYHMKGQF